MAGIAVLRFNFRGTSSDEGTSEGVVRRRDGRAVRPGGSARRGRGRLDLPAPWVLGWSFGTRGDLALGARGPVDRGRDPALTAAAPGQRRRPAGVGGERQAAGRARAGAGRLPAPGRGEAAVRAGAAGRGDRRSRAAKHLWVGERFVRTALTEIVRHVAPEALPLPTQWPSSGPRTGVRLGVLDGRRDRLVRVIRQQGGGLLDLEQRLAGPLGLERDAVRRGCRTSAWTAGCRARSRC